MDTQSHSAIQLLGALQSAMVILAGHTNYFRGKGASASAPILSLSASPYVVTADCTDRVYGGAILLVIPIDGPKMKGIELSIDILWDGSRWTIVTEAWADDDTTDGQRLMRALPERNASDLPTCITELHAACDSLVEFEDIVFASA